MIRRWSVVLVALVAALAAGIALGGGPLSDVGRTPEQAAAAPATPQDPQSEAKAAYADSFASVVGGGLYADRLHGHPVALLTLPGADPEVVETLSEQVQAAGTAMIGTYGLKRTLVDPGEKTLVDTLGSQLVTQLGADIVTADATTYDRIGQLVGRAVSATKLAQALDPAKRSSLLASLKGASLLTLPDGEPGVAPLVLVVTGKDVEQPVLSGLVSGLAAVARGVVVVGPTGDAAIASLRSQAPARPVATVDGTDTVAGRIASVLALIHVLSAPGGSFGASGSDGPAPLG